MEFLRKSREALEARLPEDSLTLVESLNTNSIKVSNVISTVMMISGHLRMAAQSDLLAEPSSTVATCASVNGDYVAAVSHGGDVIITMVTIKTETIK